MKQKAMERRWASNKLAVKKYGSIDSSRWEKKRLEALKEKLKKAKVSAIEKRLISDINELRGLSRLTHPSTHIVIQMKKLENRIIKNYLLIKEYLDDKMRETVKSAVGNW